MHLYENEQLIKSHVQEMTREAERIRLVRAALPEAKFGISWQRLMLQGFGHGLIRLGLLLHTTRQTRLAAEEACRRIATLPVNRSGEALIISQCKC